MRHIKADIIDNLLVALHECNMADCDEHNDLPCRAHNDNSAFGYIGMALKELGAEEAYQAYIDTGDCVVDY